VPLNVEFDQAMLPIHGAVATHAKDVTPGISPFQAAVWCRAEPSILCADKPLGVTATLSLLLGRCPVKRPFYSLFAAGAGRALLNGLRCYLTTRGTRFDLILTDHMAYPT